MKTLTLLVLSLLVLPWMAAVPAWAACSGDAGTVRDFGLHRQWRVARDCLHPARPAMLVEVAWNEAGVHGTESAHGPVASDRLLVRAGMQVTVEGSDRSAQFDLAGTALEPGASGASVHVRAGLHGAMLRATVCGPGKVRLEPGKGLR